MTDQEQVEKVKAKIAELRLKAAEYPEKFGKIKKKESMGLSKDEANELFKMFMEEKMKGDGDGNS